MTRLRRLLLATVSVAVLAGGAVRWHQQGEDRAICQAMQRLDGHTYRPDVVRTIRQSGGNWDGDHLSEIAGAADGESWPGHLWLSSEDYDYALSTCADLHVPVHHVD
jgi:hypothetical protein